MSQEELSFAEILAQYEESHRSESGPRQGTVLAVSGDSVVVDVGLKTEGVIPAEAFRKPDGSLGVEPGDLVTVTITGRSSEGYYTLSMLKVEKPKDWAGLQAAFEAGRVIGGVVTGQIKGGFRVDIGVRAFLPASRSGVREASEMEQLVGQEIRCKIIQLKVEEEDVVVDRRVVLEEEERQARERRFAEIQEGAVLEGTVRSLTNFGAFVDLGGVEGLLHVGDISWGRVNQASDVLKVGDTVKVKVLKVDPEAHRISLGLKQLTPDPWSLAAEKYPVGSRVRGRVTRLAEFGAFVELEPGLEGLIRTADMSWSRKVRKPADVLKPGEAVDVVVTSLQPAERRMGLSLKAALGDPWEELSAGLKVGDVVEGPIVKLADFGAFVELVEGVEGMIHISDITSEKRIKHPKEVLAAGQRVRAQVLEVDAAKRRIRLGMKQLEPTSVDEYIAEHKPGDTVSGRLLDCGAKITKVELGDGVIAICRLPLQGQAPAAKDSPPAKADLASLTAMLSAKWKQGSAVPSASAQALRGGQVRRFRITLLDPASKRIEVELAD
ncbi:MAG: 30S ribosomal protein S1 [Bryobacteraceae bacterium]